MSLGILQETGRRVRALAPPPRFHGVHDTLVAMSLEWDSAAANMIRGFDAQDADAFVLGIQDFFTGIVLMSQAQADFEELVR
jgi:hypothetical protein